MQRVDAKAVAAEIRAAIQAGEFRPGTPLPTNEELRARFGCGKNTVSAAIQLLKGEGILTGVGGGRTRVRVIPAVQHRSNERYHVEKRLVLADEPTRRRQGVSELETGLPVEHLSLDTAVYEIVSPAPDIAQILDVSTEGYVLRRTYTRQNREGEGITRTISYLPYDLVKDHPPLLDASNEPWPGGTLHQLFTVGVEVARIVDHVTARMPTSSEASLYDVPFNVPIILIRKVSYDTDGRAVEVADLLLPTDRVALTYVTDLASWEEQPK